MPDLVDAQGLRACIHLDCSASAHGVSAIILAQQRLVYGTSVFRA